MPELDAQHRAQLAETLADLRATGEKLVPEHGCGGDLNACVTDCPVPYVTQMPPEEIADALAPLVAEWLADAWDAGRKVGRRDSEEVSEHSHPGLVGVTCHSHDGITHWHDNGGPAYTITHPNPYRGGDS